MKTKDAKAAFEKHLKQSHIDLDGAAPGVLVQAMIDWYSSCRFDVDIDEDGDMLLFQYGTYDWGTGECFEYNITRQCITSTEDPDDQEILQLSLTMRYAPTDTLREIGSGDQWCVSPAETGDFIQFIADNAATRAIADQERQQTTLEFENAE